MYALPYSYIGKKLAYRRRWVRVNYRLAERRWPRRLKAFREGGYITYVKAIRSSFFTLCHRPQSLPLIIWAAIAPVWIRF